MKIIFIGLIALNSFIQVAGQEQRLEGDTSQFLCKNDSVDFYAIPDFKRQKIDTIIKVLYDYDNGRLETSK